MIWQSGPTTNESQENSLNNFAFDFFPNWFYYNVKPIIA
ncbi:hypothetical protein SLEP1_g41738 [Rubroshorea leprosula]|uniref:Uncharacterized protein n=1 Tax=Rubroshorea leprosula TaxID=152421 RepID=A0AAV5L841_9ROSI|nr:hypothetical protein SLEP1_g41738 [Rubroshorea leprosula]